jgi:hypothetical protein
VTALPTKNYCTPSEKLCFDYPSDWAVKATQFDPQQEGKSEEVAISDQTGKKWLNLQAGLTGVGGTCGEEPGSLTKILKTYTTKVQGSYLVSEASKEYVQSTAYAVSFISFNGEKWSQTFELNNSKTVTKPGTIGMCDTGLAVINGKNADSGLGDGKHGAFSFTNHFSDDTYDTEATATAASETPEATKAYEILRSVHYE